MTENQTLIQKLYLGFYGRPADLGGMYYWQERMDREGFHAIVLAFMTSVEASVLYSPERMAAANLATFGTAPIPPPSSEKIQWVTTKAVAVEMAKAQGKRILLLGGKKGCSLTEGMKGIACESLQPPIKALIEAKFIPWYSEKIGASVVEYDKYAAGMGTYYLPLICIIDPANPDAYLARSSGNQEFTKLYNWMLVYAG